MKRHVFLAGLTALAMLSGSVPAMTPAVYAAAASAAAAQSGECGENIRWQYADGVLTLTGSGETADYSAPETQPWYALRDAVTAVQIGEGITAIGLNAFRYFSALTAVSLPESLRVIGSGAFNRCDKLTEITFPAGVTEIGSYAFYYCAFTEITLPRGLQTLSPSAFECCRAVQAFHVQEGNSVFSEENGTLMSADGTALLAYPAGAEAEIFAVPENVTAVGGYAFNHCAALQSVTLPETVTEIGDRAFYHCQKLTDVSLPDHILTVGEQVFYDTPYLSSLADADGFYITETGILLELTGTAEQIRLPETVRCISKNAARNLSSCKKLYIPAGCTVAAESFAKCTSLESVECGDGCKIGEKAFANCTALTTVILGKNCKFAKNAFRECSALTDLQYDRPVLEYAYADAPAGAFHIAESRTVFQEAGSMPVGTLSRTHGMLNEKTAAALCDRTLYNNGFHRRSEANQTDYPDTVQEICDADGNIFAAFGFDDSMTLVPQAPDQPAVTIENPGWRFGAAAFSEQNELYVFWCFQIAKGATDDDNTAELAALAARTENTCIAKYDRNGNLLGTCGFAINDTYSLTPLDSYNASLVVRDGVAACLYCTGRIRSYLEPGKQIYHQCCTIVAADADTMEEVYVNHLPAGGHTFGVLLQPADYGLAAIGMNDVYRGFSLMTWKIADKTVTPNYLATNGQEKLFSGSGTYSADPETGAAGDGNWMYLHIGGFAQSASTIAAAGRAQRTYSASPYGSNPARISEYYNVFVSLKDQTLHGDGSDLAGELCTDAATGKTADRNVIWLTQGDAHTSFGEVKIVTLADGSYCVLWEQYRDLAFDSVRYVILDERGNLLRHETEIRGARLSASSVQPIVQGSTLTWAVSDAQADALTWYTVDLAQYADPAADLPESLRSLAKENGVSLVPGQIEFGACGVNLLWCWCSDTRSLLIAGEGAVSPGGAVPWSAYSSQIEALYLDDRITSLGAGTFDDCKKLKKVVLPDALPQISDSAFCGCTGLKEIHLPAHLQTVGRDAFSGCALESVVFPPSVTEIGENAFDGCGALKSVVLPDDLLQIGCRAFNECTALTEICLPSGLQIIGKDAFRGCDLRTVVIPASVTEIGDYAFLAPGENLKEIFVLNPQAKIGTYALGKYGLAGILTTPQVTLYGYAGSTLETYFRTIALDGYNRFQPIDGMCGDQAAWHYDSASGIVTFYGQGEIYRYPAGAEPWAGTGYTGTEQAAGITGTEQGIRGDVNCDGRLNVADAVLLARYLAEDDALILTETGRVNTDLDRSGVTTMADLTLYLNRLARLV